VGARTVLLILRLATVVQSYVCWPPISWSIVWARTVRLIPRLAAAEQFYVCLHPYELERCGARTVRIILRLASTEHRQTHCQAPDEEIEMKIRAGGPNFHFNFRRHVLRLGWRPCTS
jgi:hypothetical protein